MLKHIVWMLFSFNGRLGRLGFFVAWLGLSLSGAVLHMATIGHLANQMAQPAAERPDAGLLLLNVAFGFALAWSQFAIQAKRFHDFNWSGWWVVAPGAALAGLGVLWFAGLVSNAGGSGGEGASTYLGLGLLTIGVCVFFAVIGLMLLFRSGTAGPNTYGPQSGPPVEESRGSDWAQRVLDDPLAAAERLREREQRTAPARAEAPARPPMAAASGERVFGRRNLRA